MGCAPPQRKKRTQIIRLPLAALVAAFVLLSSTAQALGPMQHHVATVYSGPCDGQSNSMADGTTIDGAGHLWHRHRRVDDHALASSFLRVGTRILFTRKVFGAREWTVRDSGGSFDLYRPNCDYSGWPGLNNPSLSYRIEQ